MVSRLTKSPPKIITGRIASGITCNGPQQHTHVRNELSFEVDLLSRCCQGWGTCLAQAAECGCGGRVSHLHGDLLALEGASDEHAQRLAHVVEQRRVERVGLEAAGEVHWADDDPDLRGQVRLLPQQALQEAWLARFRPKLALFGADWHSRAPSREHHRHRHEQHQQHRNGGGSSAPRARAAPRPTA